MTNRYFLALLVALLLSTQAVFADETEDLNLQMIEAERACRDWDSFTAVRLCSDALVKLKSDKTAQGISLRGKAFRILGRTESAQGNFSKALRHFENALKCYRAGIKKFPTDAPLHLEMAKTLYRKADTLMNSGKLNDCREESDKAIIACNKALDLRIDFSDAYLEKMRLLISWGGLSALAKRKEYMPDLNERIAEKLEQDPCFKNDAPVILALQLMYIAQVQQKEENALSSLNEAISELESISSPPQTLKSKYHLAQALIARGDIYKKQRKSYQAIKDYDDAISISDLELVHDVTFAPYHQTKAEALAKKANIVSLEKNYDASNKTFQDSLKESEILLKQFPKNTYFNLRRGEATYAYALALSREPNFNAKKIRELYLSSKLIFKRILISNPKSIHVNNALAEQLICEGKFLEKLGDKPAANHCYEQSLSVLKNNVKSMRRSPVLKGLALKQLGRLPANEKLMSVLRGKNENLERMKKDIRDAVLDQERREARDIKREAKQTKIQSPITTSVPDYLTGAKVEVDLVPTNIPNPDASHFPPIPEREFWDPVPGILEEIDKLDKETE